MYAKPIGLTELTLDELKKLLRFVYRHEVEFPLNAQRIACIGFQHRQTILMGALRGLDAKAVQTVLVCVIAERLQSQDNA